MFALYPSFIVFICLKLQQMTNQLMKFVKMCPSVCQSMGEAIMELGIAVDVTELSLLYGATAWIEFIPPDKANQPA
jgi:hypothetical protein